MLRELSTILCDLDLGIKVKECIFLKIHLLLNHWMYLLQTLQVHRSHHVEGTGQIFCDIGHKVKGQIVYFPVNASLP